ncbi:MAG: single-stranded DNA-binding protein [Clostridiales bacterium]|jgi:single-stranded DNA-binding protein|nr:single-stranded DNA-binding protein [Clostridiales bacterium]
MNYDQINNNNTLHLRGVIDSEPKFSHEVVGEGFYEVNLKVKRLSEQYDILPITISERLLADNNAEIGTEISVYGQFRSYNKTDEEKSRLMLTVFVREITEPDEKMNPNIITLTGYLCKQPVYRTTPFNREIADMLLAVNRAYNKSDYIPCIAWGRNARFVKNMNVGDKITVSGRIQSREYQKNIDGVIVSKTAYEVSVNKIFAGERGNAGEDIGGVGAESAGGAGRCWTAADNCAYGDIGSAAAAIDTGGGETERDDGVMQE